MTSSTTTSLFLSPLQISALLGIVDVLIPSIPSKSNDDADLNTFWQCDLTQDVDFRKALLNAIDKRLDPVKRSEISFLLNLLSSPMGSWLFFFPYAGLVPPFASSYLSFAEWSREKRQVALKSLQQSHLWQKRMVFNGLKRLIAGIALTFVPESTNGNSEDLRKNPFWSAMGYSGPYHWGITAELDEQMIQNDTASADISLKKEAFINCSPLIELEFDCIVIVSETTSNLHIRKNGNGVIIPLFFQIAPNLAHFNSFYTLLGLRLWWICDCVYFVTSWLQCACH